VLTVGDITPADGQRACPGTERHVPHPQGGGRDPARAQTRAIPAYTGGQHHCQVQHPL